MGVQSWRLFSIKEVDLGFICIEIVAEAREITAIVRRNSILWEGWKQDHREHIPLELWVDEQGDRWREEGVPSQKKTFQICWEL